MRELDLDTLLFFDACRDALPIFAALEAKLYERFPETQKRVQKTQITYYHKHVYACVSFARVRRRAELPESWLTLTLGLPYALDSERVAVKTEVYPGRWTTHFVISAPEELDEELFSWIGQAYVFSERKRQGSAIRFQITEDRPCMSTKKFYAEATCTGCGKCAANCPGGAISMTDGRPVWTKSKCLKCCACINRCPVSAIQYGSKTVSRNRYVNPVLK